MKNDDTIHALTYFNLLKTGSWIEDKVKKALKPFNLTHAQLNTLYILMENHPNPVSANNIKDKILVSNPDVTRLMDRMVNKNYVIREVCPQNRRKIDISLTENGKEIFINAHEAVKVALGNFFEEKISHEEAQILRQILHKIRE